MARLKMLRTSSHRGEEVDFCIANPSGIRLLTSEATLAGRLCPE